MYSTGEETFGEDLALLAGLVAGGGLTPQDWHQAPAAVAALRARQATGKLVLTRG